MMKFTIWLLSLVFQIRHSQLDRNNKTIWCQYNLSSVIILLTPCHNVILPPDQQSNAATMKKSHFKCMLFIHYFPLYVTNDVTQGLQI